MSVSQGPPVTQNSAWQYGNRSLQWELRQAAACTLDRKSAVYRSQEVTSSKQVGTNAMKTPKSDAKVVAEAMANDRVRANLAFDRFVAHWMERDAQKAIANTRAEYPDWPDEQLELNVRFGWISDWPNGWYLRGMARRLATDDLDEFGLFIQMHVRQAILNHDANEDECTDVWTLLPAIAIGDDLAIERYVDIATFPLSDGHPDTRTIYNGVHAILRSHAPELGSLQRKRMPEKKPAWIKGIIACLQGIISKDSSRVASGIEQHLDGFRKGFRIDPLEKIISLEAHGLFRLAERIDGNLVREFDTERGIPWDRDFHAWSSSTRPALATEHFGSCPKPLAAAFVNLERPQWAI